MISKRLLAIFGLGICAALLIVLSLSMIPATATSQQVLQSGVFRILQTANSTVTSTSTTTNQTTTANAGPIGFITTPVVAWVKLALTPYIGEPPRIPFATFFTLGVAACLALISSTAAKLLVDYDMVKSSMREVQAWQKEMNAARKAKDDQTIAKLTKKQAAMMKQQSRASMEQMKVTAVTFVPFLIIWYTLNAVLGPSIIAYAPFPLPFMGTNLKFFYWYLLCSFAMNFPLMRLFGIGMSDT
ncbi:MAG TPA: EMC3/TMCO1 family protein [Candidatus Acidoferrales bacterium]|nr:EMC3/TMCO1 family protein [Candidatus Acidoferrales bacterium]